MGIPGTIFDELQSTFHASAAQITLLGSLFLYPYAASQLFVGVLVDKYGPGRILVAGSFLMVVGGLLCPLSTTLGMLYLGRIAVGFGASVLFLSMIKVLDQLFDQSVFAVLLGVSLFFGFAGGLTATVPFERATAQWGWRAVLLAVGILSGLSWIATVVIFKRAGQFRRPRHHYQLKNLGLVIINPASLPIVITAASNFVTYFIIQAIVGKKLLQDCYGIASPRAALVLLATISVMMAGCFLMGFISRKMNNRRKPLLVMAASVMLVTSITLWLNMKNDQHPALSIICFLMAGLSASASPIFNSVMKENNAAHAVASSVAYLNTTCYVMVAVLSQVAGYLITQYTDRAIVTPDRIIYPIEAFRAVIGLAILTSICSLTASLFIRETHGKHLPESP